MFADTFLRLPEGDSTCQSDGRNSPVCCRAGNGLQLLPGVKVLLEKLRDTPNVRTSLVTGNLQPIGWAKMDALGIGHLFTDPRCGTATPVRTTAQFSSL